MIEKLFFYVACQERCDWFWLHYVGDFKLLLDIYIRGINHDLQTTQTLPPNQSVAVR